MKYCPNCGKKNDVESKFCSNCGTEIKADNSRSSDIEDKLESINNSDQSVSFLFLHYILIPINIILPWSIVSWIGIPLTLYSRNKLNSLTKNNPDKYKNHLLWTNISLGVFIFYLLASIIRAITINFSL